MNVNTISAEGASEAALIKRINALVPFPDVSERSRIISGLRWISLLSSEKATLRAANLLDGLCARLEQLMHYEEGERDLVMLQLTAFGGDTEHDNTGLSE